MKLTKIMLAAFAVSALFVSCSKEEESTNNSASNEIQQEPSERQCASMEVLNRQLAEDPGLAARMAEIDRIANEVVAGQRLLPDGTIEIPVVFNVLYKSTAQNISLTQLQSQIDILNQDYGATNADYNNTPSIFQGVRSGNTGIRFVLDQVIRKSTTKTSWQTNDDMKKSTKGGLNPTSPTTKLNIWVCNLSNNILGYAQFPGGSSATDGVVLDDNCVGVASLNYTAYNKGRTATHEVGHWLNLRHIWGDATCGSDLVSDTPSHNTSNYGCPAYPHYSTCTGAPVEMTMNYMDYTDDACMYMFSAGQKTRMNATFVSGGGRNSFAQP
ncbi:MAG: zinc metalloprotease [Bacteroidota bacterium]